jgi:hypothetical protein
MASMAERPDPQPDPHSSEDMVGPHGSAEDHGGDHGHDDHAHGGTTLGPVDVQAWGALAVGVVLGLVVVFALIQSLS